MLSGLVAHPAVRVSMGWMVEVLVANSRAMLSMNAAAAAAAGSEIQEEQDWRMNGTRITVSQELKNFTRDYCQRHPVGRTTSVVGVSAGGGERVADPLW